MTKQVRERVKKDLAGWVRGYVKGELERRFPWIDTDMVTDVKASNFTTAQEMVDEVARWYKEVSR